MLLSFDADLPVCLRQLAGNVLKHFLHALPSLAGRLVNAGHEVVALLAEGLHVGVCDGQPGLLVKLVTTARMGNVKTLVLSLSSSVLVNLKFIVTSPKSSYSLKLIQCSLSICIGIKRSFKCHPDEGFFSSFCNLDFDS